MLLAVGQLLNLGGAIITNGGLISYYVYPHGSGGAIRIIAENITGAGSLNATGAVGNNGRIRIESGNGAVGLTSVSPAPSVALPGSPPVIWPAADAPKVSILSINGVSAPADPQASLGTTPDVVLVDAATMTVRAETLNFPTNGTVQVRWMHTQGPNGAWVAMELESGDSTQAVWKATVDRDPAANGPYIVWQAKARAAVPPN